ncbi:hypothetical protein K469DRAFT_221732 [Zopfia rhizophila CBS 207.26]|uniref:Secreted protein n=1 Tax=Zopfia rhizophila CBS 207.26 TaxID=1314779 RepID=A0A6A6DT59_9PEZI|nr:hypothetical protein K469DRAFT_221732 [Zopfia rhizophila CBS 207.26]
MPARLCVNEVACCPPLLLSACLLWCYQMVCKFERQSQTMMEYAKSCSNLQKTCGVWEAPSPQDMQAIPITV